MLFDSWFSSSPPPRLPEEKPANIYYVLNKELDRLHEKMRLEMNEKNINIWWNRIKDIQDGLLAALEKQPADEETIRDLQEAVSELYLIGGPDAES